MIREIKTEGYGGRRWKPSATAAREFAQKMDAIEDFTRKNNISMSANGDSYYFTIDGQSYRVSNHSVEASDVGAYKEDPTTGERVKVRDKYHDGRKADTIYIHAGKTRIEQIYNDLNAGRQLDGRGNVIYESLHGNIKDIDDILVYMKSNNFTVKDLADYTHQRMVARKNGIDIKKIDDMLLSGKSVDSIAEYIYKNRNPEIYKSIYNNDSTLEEDFEDDIDIDLDTEQEYELAQEYLESLNIEELKSVLRDLDSSKPELELIDTLNSFLDYKSMTFETATLKELLKLVNNDIDIYKFVYDEYVTEDSKRDKTYKDQQMSKDADDTSDYHWRNR